jgi:hypothetical protein
VLKGGRKGNLTLDVNYYCALTFLMMVLFALIGFALCRARSFTNVIGIFFAYVLADKSAVFIRDGLNFVFKLKLGDEILPYLQGTLFFVAVIAMTGCLFGTEYKHTFKERLVGMLLGIMGGYLVSVFALEFLRGLLVGVPKERTVVFDFSYALPGWEGLFVLTLNFFPNAEDVYKLLNKLLIPVMLYILFLLLGCALQWFIALLGKIWKGLMNWVSIGKKA